MFNAMPNSLLYQKKLPSYMIQDHIDADENPWQLEQGFESEQNLENPYAFPRPVTGEC